MIVDIPEAWLLHKKPSGESSVYLTLFTQEKGLIHCLYKGFRTAKKQARLQAFTPLCLSLDSKKDFFYGRQLEAASLPIDFKGPALYAALYVNELITRALRPADSMPLLFKTYVNGLHELSLATDNPLIEVVLRRLEWQLLLACGQAFSCTTEASSDKPISEKSYYRFRAPEGFVLTQTGLSGKDILALAAEQFESPEVLRLAKYIMRQAIDHLLSGQPLKSRELFRTCLHSR